MFVAEIRKRSHQHQLTRIDKISLAAVYGPIVITTGSQSESAPGPLRAPRTNSRATLLEEAPGAGGILEDTPVDSFTKAWVVEKLAVAGCLLEKLVTETCDGDREDLNNMRSDCGHP
ncbi:hypothetical protein KM043_007776 [Ampulex compressa]|nr:hypothetical protein KM043_007776 [Ampulex compressa]